MSPSHTLDFYKPNNTHAFHTETAALGLSIGVVEAAINDVFETHSDGATSQNLDHDLAVELL